MARASPTFARSLLALAARHYSLAQPVHPSASLRPLDLLPRRTLRTTMSGFGGAGPSTASAPRPPAADDKNRCARPPPSMSPHPPKLTRVSPTQRRPQSGHGRRLADRQDVAHVGLSHPLSLSMGQNAWLTRKCDDAGSSTSKGRTTRTTFRPSVRRRRACRQRTADAVLALAGVNFMEKTVRLLPGSLHDTTRH